MQHLQTKKMMKYFSLLLKSLVKYGSYIQIRRSIYPSLKNLLNQMRLSYVNSQPALLFQSVKNSLMLKFKMYSHPLLSDLLKLNGSLAESPPALCFTTSTLAPVLTKSVCVKSLWNCAKKILLWLEEHVLQSLASSQLSWKNKTLLLNCYQSSDNLHKTNKMQFVFFVLNRLF